MVSALSVALYGMFIAIIIPPAKKSLPIALCVAFGFGLSLLLSRLPVTAGISEGMRTILLTVFLAALAAWIFPVKEDPYG